MLDSCSISIFVVILIVFGFDVTVMDPEFGGGARGALGVLEVAVIGVIATIVSEAAEAVLMAKGTDES